ncbi:hypothetical protein DRQ21_07260 [Candidatus Fermentibacteria bacterium]|nr:MAG: hypothetical protein DRQ21_07260 [Candidatus Fermentibacteria bacterium]
MFHLSSELLFRRAGQQQKQCFTYARSCFSAGRDSSKSNVSLMPGAAFPPGGTAVKAMFHLSSELLFRQAGQQ